MASRQISQIKARILSRIFCLRADFTAVQVVRLVALRHRMRGQPGATHALDERRLAFGRWLVAHGYLSEEVRQDAREETREL
jgi:hypothetical protein